MKRSRFTEDQIIGVLKEHQAGATALDLCRKHGISDATFYKWRSKYGGLEVSEAKRPRGLEEENARLKKSLAFSAIPVNLRLGLSVALVLAVCALLTLFAIPCVLVLIANRGK